MAETKLERTKTGGLIDSIHDLEMDGGNALAQLV